MWQVKERWWREDGSTEVGVGLPPQRESFGVGEDELKPKTGVKMGARRGKQNTGRGRGELKRQRSGENDRQWEQQRKNRRKRLREKKVQAAHSLPTVLH